MNNRIVLYLSMVVLAMMAASCTTYKHVRYLQDMPKEGMPITENL